MARIPCIFSASTSPQYTYAYQYATDITYAYQGGWSTYESYVKNGLANTALTFTVPILENMPAVTKLPTSAQEDEYQPEPDPSPIPILIPSRTRIPSLIPIPR